VTLSGFPELGEVTIAAPAYYGDLMYPADSTHPAVLQLALLTIFGATDASAAARTIRGDEAALDALIPVERRWWAPTKETLPPRSAGEDAGVAVEVLATSQHLGGMPVEDIAGPEAAELAADVLLSAGSWKHGPRIVVDGSQPADGSRERSVARASFAGWANDANEGFVVAVTSGGWDDDANVYPLGHRLHTSILWWTAPTAGVTEGAGTMHRIMLHCPGEDACQRDGCNDTLDDTVLAAIGLVADDVAVTAPIAAGADWAADAYRASLLGTGYDEPEDVLSVVTQPLMAAGWEEISSSSSELGDTEVLLCRGQQVLTAAYRPLTREVVLADGRPELDMVCHMLADDSVLVEDSGGVIRVDRAAAASADWSNTLLTVIEKHLVGELTDDSAVAKSIHILLAGIWPWGTGVPHSDHDWDLLHRQVMVHLRRTALLGN
jgi:hypothetical protein